MSTLIKKSIKSNLTTYTYIAKQIVLCYWFIQGLKVALFLVHEKVKTFYSDYTHMVVYAMTLFPKNRFENIALYCLLYSNEVY